MSSLHIIQTFFLKHYNILGTPVFALLLLVLEDIMDLDFSCPSDLVLGRWYSAMFFTMPSLVLWLLGYKLSGGRNKTLTQPRQIYYCLKEIFYGPLLWVLILLADGRHLACFLTSFDVRYGRTSYIKSVTQICGIIGICLVIMLSFYSKSCFFCRSSGFNVCKRYERDVLWEIEEALHDKEKEKRKKVIDDIVRQYEDRMNMTDTKWLTMSEDIIKQERLRIKEIFQQSQKITSPQREVNARGPTNLSPGGQTSPPPVGQTSSTPVGQTSPPPVGQTSLPPVGQTSLPPVGQTSPPPVGQTSSTTVEPTSPPSDGQTSLSPGGQASPPTVGPTSLSPRGQTSPPPVGQTSSTPGGQTSPPPVGKTSSTPVESTSPPSDGQTSLSPGGQTSPPQRGQTSPPLEPRVVNAEESSKQEERSQVDVQGNNQLKMKDMEKKMSNEERNPLLSKYA
ncbi:uncharacterized protein [Dendropsophus ebraccatus]|uniref:uncharacterized protein n=1 Tax=Dendropsophus ebraccatus TaxID=150705 RepID=UPI003831C1D9